MAVRRYLVFGPPYTHRSGGIVALYHLQRALIRRGHDCIYYAFGTELVAVSEVTADDVVIYPEIVLGNPLGARRVVRWLLNNPGVCGGDGKYADTDLVFSYTEAFKHPRMVGYLYVPVLNNTITDLGLERTYDCVFFHKGSWKPRIKLDAIEIVSGRPLTDNHYVAPSKAALLAFLQHCRTFYSYDDVTTLASEAALSGCQVKLIDVDGRVMDYPFPQTFTKAECEAQMDDFLTATA